MLRNTTQQTLQDQAGLGAILSNEMKSTKMQKCDHEIDHVKDICL